MSQPRDDSGQFTSTDPSVFDDGHGPLSSADERGGGLVGGATGAAAGFYFGGPAGAAVGGLLGWTLGESIDD